MERYKIAVFIGETFAGGVGQCLLNYFRHIDGRRFQYVFFVGTTPEASLCEEIASRGGRVIVIPPRRRLISYFAYLIKAFRAERYDIVHANLTTLNVLPLLIAKMMGVRVRISHAHSTTNPVDRVQNFVKIVLRLFSHCFATDYFACSEQAGRWLFGDSCFEAGQVCLVKNAIEIDRFLSDPKARDRIRSRFGLSNKLVMGHIGRFTVAKNHDFIVSIFESALMRNLEMRLLLVGDGELRHRIQKRVEADGIADKVVFVGNQTDVAAFYSAMDIFVFPSIFEGLGMALVEAQVNGLPAVVSTEVSKETELGKDISFLPLSMSVEKWAEKCLTVARQRCPSDVQLGDRFREYDIRTAAKRLEDLYCTCLSRPSD